MRGMKTDMQNQVERVDWIGLSLQTTLVKNQGLTLEGVRQRMTEDRRSVERRVKVLGMLKEIKNDLVQVRKAL